MRRHHVIPLDHPVPATTEPNPITFGRLLLAAPAAVP
jgi:hypothetical protein